MASDLPKSPGHRFATAPNRLLAEHGFDPLVEKCCDPYDAETFVRPGVLPGVFFRMLVVGSFEGLQSHRLISWRCTNSRALGEQTAWIHFERPLSALDRLVAALVAPIAP